MMYLRRKIGILRAMSIMLLLLAAVICYYEFVKPPAVQEIPQVNIVVAVRDIPENTVLTNDMINVESMYAEDVKQYNIVFEASSAVGMRTLAPVFKGEVITTNRLIKNEPHMNKSEQTQIALSINDVDKALDLRKGDYIDIWLEPKLSAINSKEDNPYYDENNNYVVNEPLSKIEPHKLFGKVIIVNVHDSSYVPENNAISYEESGNVYVPSYITIELDDEDIKLFYSVLEDYNIRITRYGEEKKYAVLKNILSNNSNRKEEIKNDR